MQTYTNGDKPERKDGTWSRSDFEWDEDNNRYVCPEGNLLNGTGQNQPDPRNKQPRTDLRKYRTNKNVCDIYLSKSNCCHRVNASTITCEEHEDARDFT